MLALRTISMLTLASALALGVGVGLVGGPAVPTRLLDEGFAGSESCRECHARNAVTWDASYHKRMTQEATPEAVLAPFADFTPVLEGVTWKLSREPDGFYARPYTPAGAPVANPMRVALTTGSHHYQIYWLDVKGQDELGQLPLVWHLAEKRWVPRKSVFLAPAPESVFAEGGRWPRTCIKCHATNGTQRHASDGKTHVAEFGIACEACHGPGAEHVKVRREHAARGQKETNAPIVDASIANPAELAHDRATEVCGQCHGIHPETKAAKDAWESSGYAYRPGDVLAASRDLLRGVRERNTEALRGFLDRNPSTLAEMFWSDGEVRVSGREYNGLVESACFQRGTLSCLTCHEMHPSASDPRPLTEWADDQLKPGMRGATACLGCHAAFADPAKRKEHTHHAASSSGDDCLNCHMPYTTYGLTKAMRSHTITIPSIAASLATGRPDACNQCHLDKPIAWAAEALHAWYGHPVPPLDDEQRTTAASVVWALSGDAGLRAIMAWSLGWSAAREVSGTGWMPFVLSSLMQDPYDAVRFIAARTARLDPRHAGLELDFTTDIEAQRDVVRKDYLSQWLRDGLTATANQRSFVLVGTDGKLDEARFRALAARIDKHVMTLAE